MDRREVEGLVKVAFGGGAVPEVRDCYGPVAADLAGQRRARRVRDLGGHRTTAGENARPCQAVMSGHLAAAGHRVVSFGKRRQKQLVGSDAERDDRREAAVIRHHHVALAIECEGTADA